MRTGLRCLAILPAACALVVQVGGAFAQVAEDAPTGSPEDILRNIVVAASAGTSGRPLPRLAVHPTLATDENDISLRNVVRRDLDLSGEFEVLPEPEAVPTSEAQVDLVGWKARGVDAVVQLVGRTSEHGRAWLEARAWLLDAPDAPVLHQRVEVERGQVRAESHRLADAILGALTGTGGGFSSAMTFVFGYGKARRAYVIDSDGHDPHAVSPPEQLALAPTFGPGHQLYWVGSTNHGAFRLYRSGQSEPLPVAPRGSVYGLSFSRTEDEVAVSIAQGAGIHLFRGPTLDRLAPASDNDLAMHPTWSPNGRLAFVGETKWGTRVFVDGKAVSPAGVMASAPVFCRHPDGVRLLFAIGAGKSTDLVSTGEGGGPLLRLTQGGTSRYPACSPDGRLVAFFSTRTTGEGPGLYIMRIDGSRAKRVSTLVGDSLRWARTPIGKVERIGESR